MEVEESSIPPDHKLSGFLTTVLSSTNPQSKTLEFGNHLQFFSHKSDVGFKSNSGVILSPIPYSGHRIDADESNLTETPMEKKRKKKLKNAKSPKKIGSVHGNGIVSVVHQLKTLMKCKCLKFVARVLGISIREDEDVNDGCEIRVAVLIDVFLPIELEFGWQFPKSATTAASLFRHLSCNWRERALILKDGYCIDVVSDYRSLWQLPDCRVLGCKQHSDNFDPSKKKGFELHEIFKSLPSLSGDVKTFTSRILPEDMASAVGIWDLTDDIVEKIISFLHPIDIMRVSATCRHLRILSVSIMPCIKLKLFPHQQAAVEWMVQRERKVATLHHPLYLDFLTEDGFSFYINIVSGEIITGTFPKIKDFRGGMFCDEPGLGKTITALSLILKTQGTLADPPEGAETIWCSHNGDQKYGYYECSSGSRCTNVVVPSLEQKCSSQGDRRGQFSPDELIPKDQFMPKRASSGGQSTSSMAQSSSLLSPLTPTTCFVPCTRSLNRVKRNLMHTYEETSAFPEDNNTSSGKQFRTSYSSSFSRKRRRKDSEDLSVVSNETWIQCDACQKWRRLSDQSLADSTTAWFCSLNSDFLYQSCDASEESWDYKQPVTYLPGFYSKDSTGELPQNVAFFTSVLKEHYSLLNCHTKKSLKWLAKLPYDKLLEMESVGLACHGQLSSKQANGFSKIFQAFGLERRVVQGSYRWFYPKALKNLAFDLPALRIALCERLDSFRMYLSRATLIIVPSNLVNHWNAQIHKHVKPGQLRVYVWTDLKKKHPSVHNLAWDYDVVITTFSRLSAEWKPNKRSVLMQIHWMRVMLDEGHTLGSMNMTNKMQMAVSLSASNRWILTGTPTPNTPSSQISHIQPMLKFLHDEVYGESYKHWEAGILKPFEAQMEEGKLRLLQLLERCMISARKADIRCIPPCVKKTTCLDFTEEHAKTYNELVVTVRRNILMADWNDPSHVQSLLNPKNWKSRTNTIKNVRLSCCVAGHMKVSHFGHDIQETMDILVQNGLNPLSEEYALVRYSLSYGGNCQRCKEWCRLPIVTPCRHLLCLDCVGLDSERCVFPGCSYLYEMESPEIRKRQENPNPKWPVPKDLIELQPSYMQDSWDPDWKSTSSSKVAYLVQRLKEIQADNRQKDSSLADRNYAERTCDFILSQGPFCKPSIDSSEARAEKVIVFSQFLEHINVIEHQLAIADINFVGLYNPLNISHKNKALISFQHDPTCMVLVMDGSAALGLDFSFVTHVFLMEPIWDLSMEDQVISRAHRMGAVRPVHVETLVMRGTIEEQMLDFLQNVDEGRRVLKEDHEKTKHEGARAHKSVHNFAEETYLVRLGMVRTNG